MRTRVREAAGRTAPGRALVARRDRKVLIDLIVRSRFVDLAWYEAITGVTFASEGAAASHCLDVGGEAPLAPLLAVGPPRGAADSTRDVESDHMVRYLVRGNLGYMPTPVFDDEKYLGQFPEAARHPGRARGHFLASAGPDTPLPVPVAWDGPVPLWGDWHARMMGLAADLRERERSAGAVGWDRLSAELSGRDPRRVSILIPTINDWRLTDTAIGALLRNSEPNVLEIVIVDNGSTPGAALGLAQSVAGRDPAGRSIKVRWLAENRNFAGGTNLAFAGSTGGRVVLLNNDTAVQPFWLQPLLDELENPDVVAVQPLLLYGDGTVQTAGTGFPDCGGLPSHMLVAHPQEDATRLGRFDVSAVTAAAMAMRADDYCRLRGLDERYVNGYEDLDLCLRALARPGARLRVATDSRVVHFESQTRAKTVVESNRELLWTTWGGRLPAPDMGRVLGAAGFGVIRWEPGLIGRTGLGRIPLPVIARRPLGGGDSEESVLHLRWAIKMPVPFEPTGTRRGVDERASVVTANAIAEALRRMGQDVVLDHMQAHQRSTSGLDDAVLVLGPTVAPFEPQPGRPNFLLPISAEAPDGEEEARLDFVWTDVAPAPTDADGLDRLARELVAAAADWRARNPDKIGSGLLG